MNELIRRCKGDAGQVGGIEVLPFGFLIFVSVTLLLVNAWGVIDAKLATTSASREAVRAFVEASDLADAVTAAELRATKTLEAYGRSGNRTGVNALVLNEGYSRCARIKLTVTYDVPALAIPFIGGFGDAITVQSTSTELIDPFRDGIPGVATC
mgnify:CR=1 FL=1